MIFLASAYTHPDPQVREQRFHAACAATAALIQAGHLVYSPIVHSHPLTRFGLPGDWGFWRRLNHEHLEKSDVLVVLMLPGWEQSAGVQVEMQLARELGIPIDFWEPRDLLAQGSPTLAHVANGTGL